MLDSIYVVPGYTFFYWGFTLPQRDFLDFTNHFGLKKGTQIFSILLEIRGKPYPAKIRLARITTERFPHRNVVQIYYQNQYETLKALRKFFVYSYASTINKSKPKLKELMELEHLGGNRFRVKAISRQQTDFDEMFDFLEDKNLFEYWRNRKQAHDDPFFIDFARSWLPAEKITSFKNRVNVIYLLFNSKTKQLYVGKANKFGSRVKQGMGRIGLDREWDKFMYFEIDPKYAPFIEQIESFTIRAFSSLLLNDVGINPLLKSGVRLVNRQVRRK